MANLTESTLEDTALQWLKDLGYEVLFGPDISPDSDTLFQQEREDYPNRKPKPR